MPLRPPPLAFRLAATADRAGFEAEVRELAAHDGATVTVSAGEGDSWIAVLALEPPRMAAAFERHQLDLAGLDPPDDDRYELVFRWLAADEDDPSPRLIAEPELASNWAAWGLVEIFVTDLAERLDGTDITGDPPPWLQRELEHDEPSPAPQQPFVAIRRSPLFPGCATVLDIGREESLATMRQLLAARADRFVACMQVDPRSAKPTSIAAYFPIAMAMRILAVEDHGHQLIVIAKGIARVRLRGLDDARREVTLDHVPDGDAPALDVADLRRLARFEPMIQATAGVTRQAASQHLPPGALCDFIAANALEPEAYAPVLQAVDVVERVGVTRRAFAPLLGDLP